MILMKFCLSFRVFQKYFIFYLTLNEIIRNFVRVKLINCLTSLRVSHTRRDRIKLLKRKMNFKDKVQNSNIDSNDVGHKINGYVPNRIFLVEERLNKHPNLILNDTELSEILLGYYNPRLIKNLIKDKIINPLWVKQWQVKGSKKKYPIDLAIDIYRKWAIGEIELSIK